MEKQNLFACAVADTSCEQFDTVLESIGFRLERIVSHGQATPVGEWYDQDCAEWVVLLKGAAGLRIEGEAEVLILAPGDHVQLPAHLRHRVEWTQADGETVWLALHYPD